jgi:hypothetical protein
MEPFIAVVACDPILTATFLTLETDVLIRTIVLIWKETWVLRERRVVVAT